MSSLLQIARNHFYFTPLSLFYLVHQWSVWSRSWNIFVPAVQHVLVLSVYWCCYRCQTMIAVNGVFCVDCPFHNFRNRTEWTSLKQKLKRYLQQQKVPGSVDILLLIFNWTQRGLETGFLASAIPSIRSASTRQRGRERGFGVIAKAD